MHSEGRLRAQLDGLLEIGRRLRAGTSAEALHAVVADAAASTLGFRTAVVNLYRPAWDDFVAAVVHGTPAARAALEGTTSTWADWTGLVEPGPADGAAHLVREGERDWSTGPTSWVPPFEVPEDDEDDEDDEGAWRPEDALFASLRAGDGSLLGILSLDEPVDGRRPGVEALRALGTLADHLAQALEAHAAGAARERQRVAFERLALVSSGAWESAAPEAVARAVCAGVADTLGFEEVEVAAVAGDELTTLACEGARSRLAGLSSAEAGALLEGGEEAEGCVVVDAGRAPAAWSPPRNAGRGPRGWTADGLLVALTGRDGRLAGLLRAAAPRDRLRPDLDRLRLLAAFARQAAAGLDSAAAAALRDSEARKAAILASAPDAVVTMDAQGVLLEVNPAAERMFEVRAADVLGRHVSDVMARPERRAEHRAEVMAHLADVLAGHPVERVETRARRASGASFPCEVGVVRIEQDGPPRLTAHLRDISESVQARKVLESERDRARHAALHDALTGLPNRSAAERALAGLRGAPAGSVVALCLDVDDFRLINESLGHGAGDGLLSALSARLEEALDESELVARLGGDVFLVILSGRPEAPEAAADRLHAVLAPSFAVAGMDLHVRAAVGVAVLAEGEDPVLLVKQADVAVARGKAEGVATTVWTPRLDDAPQRLALVTGLRRALARDEFELHYQPVHTLGQDRLSGFEALLRWRRPDGTLVPPGDFIPLAESSGLIEPIGAWVIDRACAQAAAWSRLRAVPPVVGVNLSPRQLRGTEVVSVFEAALARHRVSPSLLCAEVTESALRSGTEAMGRALVRLRDAGVELALDDFGADYSSLTRLRSLPVGMMKLDRSFLTDVPADPRATALVASLLGLARALGLRTVAEGIETPAQRRVVAELGCEFGQGFLLGRPLPAEQATELLTGTAPAPSAPAAPQAIAGAAGQPPRGGARVGLGELGVDLTGRGR